MFKQPKFFLFFSSNCSSEQPCLKTKIISFSCSCWQHFPHCEAFVTAEDFSRLLWQPIPNKFTSPLFILFSSKCSHLFMSFLKDKVTEQRQYSEYSLQLIKQLPLVTNSIPLNHISLISFFTTSCGWLMLCFSFCKICRYIVLFLNMWKCSLDSFFVHHFSVFPFPSYFFN